MNSNQLKANARPQAHTSAPVALDSDAHTSMHPAVSRAFDLLERSIAAEAEPLFFETMNWFGGDLSTSPEYLKAATTPMLRGTLLGAMCAERYVDERLGAAANDAGWPAVQSHLSELTALRAAKAGPAVSAWYARFDRMRPMLAPLADITDMLDTAPNAMAGGYMLGVLLIRQAASSALSVRFEN